MSTKRDLTTKQFIFCKEYLVDFNATRAAIVAGYSEKTAKSQGSRMLTNVNIKAFLDKQKTKRADKLDITIDSVVQELAKIAFHDIRKMYNENGELISIPDLDDETAATISSFKSRKENKGQDDYDIIDEYKRHDKVKTLELLGKHLGMFDNTKENPDKPANNTLTKSEISKAIAESLPD